MTVYSITNFVARIVPEKHQNTSPNQQMKPQCAQDTGALFGKVGTLNISMKTTLALLVAGTMMQGCAAIGPAAGLVALGGIKQNAAKTTDWASRVEHMNCSQMRTELASLNKRGGFMANMVPGNNTAAKISALKTHMRRNRCRIPA